MAGLDVTLKRTRDEVVFAGELRPSGVAGTFAGIEWSEVDGLITFSEQQVQFYQVSGKLNGQPVSVDGKVLKPMKEPELQVKLVAKAIDPTALSANCPVTGAVDMTASLSGKWLALQADGTVNIANGSVGEWKLGGFVARFSGRRLADGWLIRLRHGQGTTRHARAGETDTFPCPARPGVG